VKGAIAMSRGRPATGRQRSKKLHLWILPRVFEDLQQLCLLTKQDKTEVVESAISEQLAWFKGGY
jgi:hypothetical protein